LTRLPQIFSGFSGTAGRFGGIAGQILQDRLELLALELREAKIRFIQALLLTCFAVEFSLLGFLLLVLTGLYLLPPEWRIYGLVVMIAASILTAWTVFIVLCRLLSGKLLAFDQSLSELKKDMACFSTGS
jgi:uncharacterized membrane protein YqjE